MDKNYEDEEDVGWSSTRFGNTDSSALCVGDQRLRHVDYDGSVFEVVWNDGSERSTLLLFGFKKVIQDQLPNMPRDYIIRILMDRSHRCVLIVKSIGSSEVLGGICFRPFHYQGFAEIVFLAITEHEKSKGFGARVMNHCKEHVKTENIKFFLTYADNTAIGYFVKQGFAKKKQMVRQRWDGYIKDYVRSTLMECKILYNVNYIFIKDTLLKQKEAVVKKIRNANLASQKVHDGLDFSSGPIEISKIPGLSETSWNLRMNPSGGAQFPKIYAILQQLKKMKASEPFLYPVDAESAPNYYEIVKNPMDISTIEAKIQSNAYESKEEVISDFTLIIENCRTYNDASTIYVRYANILESKFRSFIAQQFPLG